MAALFLWCLLVIPGTREAFPTGDGAVIECNAAGEPRLVGIRAVFAVGLASLRALFFYLVAPFYTASHAQSLAINAGTVAINLIAVTAILWAVARHASATLAVGVTASLAMYLWRAAAAAGQTWWNPHLMLPLHTVPRSCSASITTAGRLSLLPVTIVMASFLLTDPHRPAAMRCSHGRWRAHGTHLIYAGGGEVAGREGPLVLARHLVVEQVSSCGCRRSSSR